MICGPNPTGIAVHPHACGEIVNIRGKQFMAFGTSPRLWGDFSPRVSYFGP